MNVRPLIEGAIFFAFGIVGLGEGIRLTRSRDAAALQDPLGSGGYLIVIGLALIVAGAAHFIASNKTNIREAPASASAGGTCALRMALAMFGSVVLYCLLMPFTGYLSSTFIFFLVILHLFAFNWYANIFLSVTFSLTFYILFDYLLTMSFPKGVFF